MVINDVASVLYLPILIFGFYQFQELFGEGYLGFNGFISLVFVLACLALPFIWTAVWCKKEKEDIEEHFSFLSNRTNPEHEKDRLEVPITYWYLQLSAIWLVALYAFPVPQMAMLILTNSLYIIYLLVSRPYLMTVNVFMCVLWPLVLITLESFILYFEIQDASLTS